MALIAVNVIGFEVGLEHLMKVAENGGDIPLQSICDDLSFSMYVEESITDTVRAIETLKKKAVNGWLWLILILWIKTIDSFFRRAIRVRKETKALYERFTQFW